MKPLLDEFLAWLEAHGGGEVATSDLGAAFEGERAVVRSALGAEGIVRQAPRATAWPCDGLGCAREVRELARPGGRTFFAVCTRRPEECETVVVSEAELAQETVSIEAFAAALQRALRLTPARDVEASKAHTRRSIDEPWLLGEELAGGERRDVFLVRRSGPTLRALLAERAQGERGTRILALTERTVDRTLAETYAEKAAFENLAERLTVEDGRIAFAAAPVKPRRALRVVPASRSSAPPAPRTPALEGLPRATRWGEITLFCVDPEDRVGVALGGRYRRLSCIDFGLATANGREPRQHFDLLRAICFANGYVQTRRFGTASNGKRILSQLRTAMKETFGLEEDPFERYSRRDKGWRTKFRALSAAPQDVKEAMDDLAARRRR